jgi:hypothetical protein
MDQLAILIAHLGFFGLVLAATVILVWTASKVRKYWRLADARETAREMRAGTAPRRRRA